MRTSLEYSVCREEKWNPGTGEYEKHITSRGYVFCIDACKTEKEHTKIVDSFCEYLEKHGTSSHGFGGGTWEDAMRHGDEKNYYYLDIPVKDMEEKEYVRDLYREWKKEMKESKEVKK